MEKLRRTGASVLEMLYPGQARCMGCGDLAGTDEHWLCAECLEKLGALSLGRGPICPRCGVSLEDARCRNCADWPADGVRIARFSYGYAFPVDHVVQQMKYSGVYNMTGWMGEKIALLCKEGRFGPVDALVPVPMHPARERDRGRNHAFCLARAVSSCVGIPVWNGLCRTRNTGQQARRKGEERRRAMQGTFGLHTDAASPVGKRFLLIDDVITTGATVNACAAVLYAAGAQSVCAAAFSGHISAPEKKAFRP